MQSRWFCAGLLFVYVIGLAGCSPPAQLAPDPLETAAPPATAVISLKREASPTPLAMHYPGKSRLDCSA